LVGGDLTKATTMKVIEVGVSDKNKVDGGKMVVKKTCVSKAPNNKKPVSPVRINQNIRLRCLD
jgi:hypothetical protein